MAWFVRRHASTASRNFLKGVFVVSLILFAFFVFSLYFYSAPLLSPPTDFNYTLGTFLFWAFIIGLFVTLVIMAVILYIFLHESEHEF